MFHSISNGDLELAETVGSIVLHALLRNEDFQNQRGRLYRHFMNDLLKRKSFDKTYFDRQVKYLNLPDRCRFLLGKFHLQAGSEISYERLSGQIERCADSRLIQDNDSLTCLFLLKDGERAETLVSRLQKTLIAFHCKAGFSDIFHHLKESSIYIKQADYALNHPSGMSLQSNYQYYKHLAVLDFIQAAEKRKEILIASEIKEIQEYNRRHGTPYTETLTIYLCHGQNVLSAAKALNIHRNTLTYRLEKIRELFPLELEISEVRLRYLLSLLLIQSDKRGVELK